MKRSVNVAFYSILFFFFSCTNRDHVPSENPFVSKGKYDDKGYEVGRWQVFNKADSHLIEEGKFSNGIRTGEWHYYTQTVDTIIWVPFSDMSGAIRTNVPNFLELVEDNESLIRFKNTDSNRLFNIVIGRGYTTDSTNLDRYKKMIYDDLSNRGISVTDSATNYIETAYGNKYLFNFVSGSTEQPKEDFILLNIAGKIDKRLIEVSLRCDKQYDSKARKVFFSILPNLFVNSRRFISSEDIITNLGDKR